MADAAVGRQPAASPGLQHGLAVVLVQHQLAFEHVDELVLVLVPVAQRRGGVGLDPRDVDAELRQPDGVAELLLLAALR